MRISGIWTSSFTLPACHPHGATSKRCTPSSQQQCHRLSTLAKNQMAKLEPSPNAFIIQDLMQHKAVTLRQRPQCTLNPQCPQDVWENKSIPDCLCLTLEPTTAA